jgi:lipid-A-disaccharide synthase
MSDPTQKPLSVMIVAGEASGDLHAAKLVRAFRDAAGCREVSFFGAAGPLMRAEGVEAVVEADGLSIVGLLEIGRALPMFLRTFRTLNRAAGERRPEVAILVDFPDFNLKLAKALKKKGIKVVYYISPQLWAWRKYRIRTIRRAVDLLISILPFEKEWYEQQGFRNVEYVGNPLAMEVHPNVSKEEFCEKQGLDPMKPIVALLPGSRGAEIARILPELVKTAEAMRERHGSVQFVMAIPAGKRGKIEALRIEVPDWIRTVEGETFDALNAADAAAITSGTATLEAGIIGTPMTIVYKTSAMNYKLLRPLITVDHFGLINLIAEKRLAKELIQDDFTPQVLSNELFRLLEPEVNAAFREELLLAVDKLGHGGASKRAATAIMGLIGG